MATRDKNSFSYRLRLGFTIKALRPTKWIQGKSWKSLQGLRRQHSKLYFLQIRRRRTFLLTSTVSEWHLIPLLRLNCNKMESTAALCSSFLRRSDQSLNGRKTNSQSLARSQGVYACCQTDDVNYWPYPPPPAFPFVGARVFPESWEKTVNKITPKWTRRTAFWAHYIVGDGPVSNGENILKTWCFLFTLCNV